MELFEGFEVVLELDEGHFASQTVIFQIASQHFDILINISVQFVIFEGSLCLPHFGSQNAKNIQLFYVFQSVKVVLIQHLEYLGNVVVDTPVVEVLHDHFQSYHWTNAG